ncbi:MAG: AbrB/MazE/SpoVT family DNA-binding domain-containing protein [archaeon]|nr:AbrB/MazE/SpoVT family DNA-binding domain-containing protein [archaeon]MCP8322314.1 AbrB/MazE/SpoVT family DNA-binding domain-containing protein [archaeon]
MTDEAILDKKGRIVIPRQLRDELGLSEGSKVRLMLSKEKIIVTKPLSPEEFINEMEGCIKEGSSIPKVNPLELKKIWEAQ